MPFPSKGFVIQSWPRTAQLRDAFPGHLLVFTFTLSRRSKQRRAALSSQRLRQIVPRPRGRRARQRFAPLPQSPLRLSLTAQLPFRFRLPDYVGGGAEQTEAVAGCCLVYAFSAALLLGSSTLYPAYSGNCDAHMSLSLQLLFVLKQTQNMFVWGVYIYEHAFYY